MGGDDMSVCLCHLWPWSVRRWFRTHARTVAEESSACCIVARAAAVVMLQTTDQQPWQALATPCCLPPSRAGTPAWMAMDVVRRPQWSPPTPVRRRRGVLQGPWPQALAT